MSGNALFRKAGLGSAVLWGVIHADPVSMSSIQTMSQGNLNWQDIAGVSYVWNDVNANDVLETGETVTFTVDMHKTNWGTHDYDALKVWIDDTPINPPSTTLLTEQFVWDYNAGVADYTDGSYSWKPWTDGDRFFSFDYTFADAGTYDLTASVMCSRDLSGLYYVSGNRWNDSPTQWDWDAWTENIHQTATGAWGSALQGETERYELNVVARSVPEPGSTALISLGLICLVGIMGVKRKKT